MTRKNRSSGQRRPPAAWRPRVLFGTLVFLSVAIAARLFVLQIFDADFYQALASDQHSLFQEFFPKRGRIFVHDGKEGRLVALAANEQRAFVYADPRLLSDPASTAKRIGEILGLGEEKIAALSVRFSHKEDPYEPVAHRVTEEQLQKILEPGEKGIAYAWESVRFYPEPNTSGHVLGFVGADEDGTLAGKYGIEGAFNKILTGTPGFLHSERDIGGRLIAVGNHAFVPAVDGADLVLTLDLPIQYVACTKLQEAVSKHEADSGSVIIVEPKTGRILAMCSVPDFDPNRYNEVENASVFNNPAVFDAYEPGSVFKPFTMAAALDTGAVEPTTTFEDTGSVIVTGWPAPLANAENKKYGVVDMTQVLEDSINTGVIFALRHTGLETFATYIHSFGFGERTGVELGAESSGDIASLENVKTEIYPATASFGQGITVTPLQIVMAYAAIANGGLLLQPRIVDEVRYADGRMDRSAVKEVRQVIRPKTANLLGAMLISVVENGHGKQAAVSGYYIGGKTGTAQVASKDRSGYDADATIGSFAGFGPVDDPRFAMIVRIDNPKGVTWAESTAAPVFGEIADFLVRYLEIPPKRDLK